MHDCRVPVAIELMQAWHRRVQREQVVQPQTRRRTVQSKGILTAQFSPLRIAHRRYNGKAIERTAQHDRKQPRVAAFRSREARELGPGE